METIEKIVYTSTAVGGIAGAVFGGMTADMVADQAQLANLGRYALMTMGVSAGTIGGGVVGVVGLAPLACKFYDRFIYRNKYW